MKYSIHFIKRAKSRGFNPNSIVNLLPIFRRFGVWNEAGDRLLLDVDSKEFIAFYKNLKLSLNSIKHLIKHSKNSNMNFSNSMKDRYRYFKKIICNIGKISHKKKITLVISEETIISVFSLENHYKRDR